MLINELKLNSKKRKRKTIGRGGKKGTYCGKGNKGQKARSGAHVDPLFEGGRSTLIDHLKKKRGFKGFVPKHKIINLLEIGKKFKDGGIISISSLIENNFASKMEAEKGIKILGNAKIAKKFTIEKNILLSASAREAIVKAGGKIASK